MTTKYFFLSKKIHFFLFYSPNRKIGRLVGLGVMVFFITHWIACSYWILSAFEGYGSSQFIASVDLLKKDHFSQYLFAFYNALSLVSGVGEGPSPETNLEFEFALVVGFMGMTIYATIIGNVGSLLSERDPSTVLYEGFFCFCFFFLFLFLFFF